jgi:regulator of ribosome biosynthesis
MALDVDYDPVKKEKEERKARVAKNQRQQMENAARTTPSARDARKKEIDRTLATTRISTASMGRFDQKLEGEKKSRGVKRKVMVSSGRCQVSIDS